MRGWRVVAVACLVLLGAIAGAYPSDAANTATWCKWPYPWPRTVNYEIVSAHFTTDHANRVQYGANTWTEARFNLIFARDFYGSQPNKVRKGIPDPNNPGYPATTQIGVLNCHVNPSPAPYRTITQATTTFNSNVNWHHDCKAAPSICASGNMYDLHNMASHEFGHWYFLLDTAVDTEDTMYAYVSIGEFKKETSIGTISSKRG